MDETERRLTVLRDDAMREIAQIGRDMKGTSGSVRRRFQSQLAKATKRRDSAAGALRKYREDKARRN
jgi:hypothetical protein